MYYLVIVNTSSQAIVNWLNALDQSDFSQWVWCIIMNFGFAHVFVKGLLNDLNNVECAMVNVSRKILMNLDMILAIFSVAWHWMLKTCIQLSITRVRSLQLCSMHATLAVQCKKASNEQQRGRPISTVVGRGTQSQRDRWDCLKFHRCHKPQSSRLPKTKSPWRGSEQERMDLLYGKEVCDKKLPWQGLELCPAGLLYQKEIEVGERIDLSSNSVATTDISSVSSITNAEDESYRVRFKQFWRDLWGWRSCGEGN